MKKQEISVAINLGAKIDEAQKNISELQKEINSLNVPASVKNEFTGLFSGMERELEKLTQKTAGGKLKLIDSSSAENSISKIDSLYDLLIQKLERHGIGTAGLKKDAQALAQINVLVKSY